MVYTLVLAFVGVASAAPQWGYGYGGYPAGGYGYGGYPAYGYGAAPYGGYQGAYNQGANQLQQAQGANLNALNAQQSQGSAVNAAEIQGSQGSAANYATLQARDAGSRQSGGQRFGQSSNYGENWGANNAYDNSLVAANGAQSQGSQGSASQLNAAQGSQGSANALNQNQYANCKILWIIVGFVEKNESTNWYLFEF